MTTQEPLTLEQTRTPPLLPGTLRVKKYLDIYADYKLLKLFI